MMVLARIFRDGGGWAAICADVGVATQGFTRDEAREMLVEAIELQADRPGMKITLIDLEGDTVLVQANLPRFLAAEVLRHHRQMQGLSVEEVAAKVGGEHGAAYADYEEGTREPPMSAYLDVLRAIVPSMTLIVRDRNAADASSTPRQAAR